MELSDASGSDVMEVRRGGELVLLRVESLSEFVWRGRRIGVLESEGNASATAVGLSAVALTGWTGVPVLEGVISVGDGLVIQESGYYDVRLQVSGSGDVVELGIGVDGEEEATCYQVADGIWIWRGVLGLNRSVSVNVLVTGAGVGSWTMEAGRLEVIKL
jgi:hypothetical protein